MWRGWLLWRVLSEDVSSVITILPRSSLPQTAQILLSIMTARSLFPLFVDLQRLERAQARLRLPSHRQSRSRDHRLPHISSTFPRRHRRHLPLPSSRASHIQRPQSIYGSPKRSTAGRVLRPQSEACPHSCRARRHENERHGALSKDIHGR